MEKKRGKNNRLQKIGLNGWQMSLARQKEKMLNEKHTIKSLAGKIELKKELKEDYNPNDY
ncbi:hypothetical protein BKH41_02170 [Helicobacter sp. 12S02232-10]|uniref:hypothetical protein n=1 Tax=Helicobacter sp. 12S02232-10 TaxID=1476197 RepID=UPI000BA5D22E|nr:hypothetical protein [Helicobacter sp. 12S02232-10]PAF49493.1 hypothetical protein BKH41_02170 [Helicobacter sp. 12S02232-10]